MQIDSEITWLTRITRLSPEACEAALLTAGGDFWEALYDLGTPDVTREELTQKLDPQQQEQTAEQLALLRKFLVCDICLEAWMRIDDEELQASHPGELGESLRPEELERIIHLLGQLQGGDLVRTALEMFYYWEQALPESAIASLARWAGHYDLATAAVALRLMSRFPEAVPENLELFREILSASTDARRYDAAWALWTLAQDGHDFPELKGAYRLMSRRGSEAEQAFAEDLLAGIGKA